MMDLIKVTWLDSWNDTAHLALDQIADFSPFERCNVGFLVKGDDEKVIMTSGLIQNALEQKVFADGIAVIPRAMIKEIKVID